MPYFNGVLVKNLVQVDIPDVFAYCAIDASCAQLGLLAKIKT